MDHLQAGERDQVLSGEMRRVPTPAEANGISPRLRLGGFDQLA